MEERRQRSGRHAPDALSAKERHPARTGLRAIRRTGCPPPPPRRPQREAAPRPVARRLETRLCRAAAAPEGAAQRPAPGVAPHGPAGCALGGPLLLGQL